MFKILRLFIAALIALEICVCQAQSTHQWSGEKWLDHNYLLKWKTDGINKSITFRVEVMAKGWLSFGLSKHGKTTEADIIIGWVDDQGQSSFNDFWVDENGNRFLDKSQDWRLISAQENASHTVMDFGRNYVTCDVTNDLEMFENEWELSNIVFAYSFLDPLSVESIGDPAFEDQIHLNFFIPEDNHEFKETDIEQKDYWINHSVHPAENPYEGVNCRLFKNDNNGPRTIVKYQTVVVPNNIKHIDHHIIFYQCRKDVATELLDKHMDTVFPCYPSNPDNEISYILKACHTGLIIGNILSLDAFRFPDDIGMTFDPDIKYVLYESHILDNGEGKTTGLNVSVALRIWMTSQKRKYEAGQFGLASTNGAAKSNWGFIVPPKQALFRVVSVHDNHCFESVEMAKDGIYIFAAMLHSHHATSQQLRHYRNDQVIRTLSRHQYDHEHQPYRLIKEPIHFLKSDKLVAICAFNSSLETKSYTPPIEHCIVGLYYYPRMSIDAEGYSFSRITYETMLNVTGLEQIEGYEERKIDAIIRKPKEYNNTKLEDFISENKYRIKDPKVLEDMLVSTERDQCCYFKDKLPCGKVKPPPNLYESIVNERLQNSCPLKNHVITKSKGVPSDGLIESLNKMKLSLRIFMNSFKLAFDLENI